MSTVINYIFELKGKKSNFYVDVDVDQKDTNRPAKPKWTELDSHKCSNCPLDSNQVDYCPAALSIVDVVDFFQGSNFNDPMSCTVERGKIKIMVDSKIKDTLYSLIGLRMAVSSCPILSQLKPMARFHEPFSDEIYTTQRIISMFLMKEFFAANLGPIVNLSLDKVVDFYQDINIVNQHLSKRLDLPEISSSVKNCMVVLNSFATSMTILIDQHLEKLKEIYS